MKSLLTLLACAVLSFGAQAVNSSQAWAAQLDGSSLAAAGVDANPLGALDLDAFLDLTPKKYRALTGERLGVKGSLALKAAQKQLKKQLNGNADADVPKGLYVVGTIFGFAWLLMGLMDDFEGNNWWVNLILALLCWLPGVIHGFIKMSDYY